MCGKYLTKYLTYQIFSLSFHFKINCIQYEKNTSNHTLMFPHFFSEYHVISLHFHLKFEKKWKSSSRPWWPSHPPPYIAFARVTVLRIPTRFLGIRVPTYCVGMAYFWKFGALDRPYSYLIFLCREFWDDLSESPGNHSHCNYEHSLDEFWVDFFQLPSNRIPCICFWCLYAENLNQFSDYFYEWHSI